MLPEDRPYVCRSWILTRALGHGELALTSAAKKRRIAEMQPEVEAAIARGCVWCAVSHESPLTVQGFIATEADGTLLFLFVPKALKHNGIEDLLYSAVRAQVAS